MLRTSGDELAIIHSRLPFSSCFVHADGPSSGSLTTQAYSNGTASTTADRRHQLNNRLQSPNNNRDHQNQYHQDNNHHQSSAWGSSSTSSSSPSSTSPTSTLSSKSFIPPLPLSPQRLEFYDTSIENPFNRIKSP